MFTIYKLLYLIDFNKLNTKFLSSNINDKAIKKFKQYPDKIDWIRLLYNKNNNIFELLTQNLNKIIWNYIAYNQK
jgi:hypothetical protein